MKIKMLLCLLLLVVIASGCAVRNPDASDTATSHANVSDTGGPAEISVLNANAGDASGVTASRANVSDTGSSAEVSAPSAADSDRSDAVPPADPDNSEAPLATDGQALTIAVKTDPITTQTQTIELEFINNTDRELVYGENLYYLEKEVDGVFVSTLKPEQVISGHGTATLLRANGTLRRSLSVESLEAGTYRFVFPQGSEDNYLVSAEFQVVE